MFLLRTRILRMSTLVALVGLLAGAISVSAAPAQQSSSAVYQFNGTPLEGQIIPGTSSKLVRNDSGVSMNLKTTQLEAGSVVTIWWVVFNNPSACSFGDGVLAQCAEMDLFASPDAMPSIMYAAGHVIGNNGKGNFAGHLSAGDASGCYTGPIFSDGNPLTFPCNPLVDTRGAEIHLAVHTHGQAVPGLISDMLSTFDGGCSNLGRGTGPNQCGTIQASPHRAQ